MMAGKCKPCQCVVVCADVIGLHELGRFAACQNEGGAEKRAIVTHCRRADARRELGCTSNHFRSYVRTPSINCPVCNGEWEVLPLCGVAVSQRSWFTNHRLCCRNASQPQTQCDADGCADDDAPFNRNV